LLNSFLEYFVQSPAYPLRRVGHAVLYVA
jgi:hypothetical protein